MNKQQLANKICTNLPSSEMRDEWLTNVTNAWIDDLNDARQSVHSKKKHSYSCQMITRPWLLKMYISSQLASDDFGLTDEQIFNLIGNHNMEPRIPKEDDHDQLDSGHKIVLIFLLFILMLFVNRACAQTAQYDTAIVRYQNIERIGSQTTDKGTVRYYAVYNDKQENISEQRFESRDNNLRHQVLFLSLNPNKT